MKTTKNTPEAEKAALHLEAIMATPEYKAYYDTLTAKIKDLQVFIKENQPRYNCAIILAVTTVTSDKEAPIVMTNSSVALTGSNDVCANAVRALLQEPATRAIAFKALSKYFHLEESVTTDDPEPSYTTTPEE